MLRCPVHITEVASQATSTWMQLVGYPGPTALDRAHGVFSVDGNSLAVAVPNDTITRVATVEWLETLTRAGLPVLCETPPGPDLAGLHRVSELVARGARVQVAEQYQH